MPSRVCSETGDYDWNFGTDQRTDVRPLNLYPVKIRAWIPTGGPP